jgi:hypothetical protein
MNIFGKMKGEDKLAYLSILEEKAKVQHIRKNSIIKSSEELSRSE